MGIISAIVFGAVYIMHRRKKMPLTLLTDVLVRSNHWVVVIDKKNRIQYISDNVNTGTSVNLSSLIGKDWNTVIKQLQGVEPEKDNARGAHLRKYPKQEGGFRWIEWKTVTHPDYNLISIGTDITLEKETEESSLQSVLLKRTLLDNFPGYVVCKDYEGRFLFANKAIAELMGKTAEEVVGLTDRDYGAEEEDVLRYQRTDRQVIESGLPIFIPEQTIRRKDGSSGIFQTSKFPVPFGKDKAFSVLVIDIDITEQKKTEAELRRIQEQIMYKTNILSAIGKTTEKLLTTEDVPSTLAGSFALIGEAAQVDRVYYFQKNGENDLVSQKVEWTYGSIKPEINNPNLQDMDTNIFPDFFKKLLEGKPYIVVTAELEEGILKNLLEEQAIISMLNIPVSVNGVFYGFIGFDDCTKGKSWTEDELSLLMSLANNIANAFERVENQRKIVESERIFRQINETIDDVFWLYDIKNRKIDYISPSCEKVLGRPQDYFYQKHDAWLDYTLPEDIELIRQAHRDIEENGYYEVGYRILTGNEQRWIFEKSFAIADENGKVIKNSGVTSDVTESVLKQKELERLLEITHRQNDRLTNFAHIISHNIRSHSSNLSSLMTLISEAKNEDEKEMFMGLMQKSTDKLSETIKNLNEIITIQNNTVLEKSHINMRHEIGSSIDALGAQIKNSGAVIVNNVPENVSIKAIPAYLESILLNFLSNAIKYRSPDRPPKVIFSITRPGNFWRLAISDNGLGIDLEKHGHKLFGMYKTFHKNPEAKGIGLFIAKSQIEAMGGNVAVESKVGEGSTFYIDFYAEN